MKKIGLISLLLVLLLLLIRPFIAEYVDADFNRVTLSKPYLVSDSAKVFYENLDFVADLHCDALLWDRDLNEEHRYGHVDIPRLKSSNIALQVFTIVTKTPRNLNFQKNDDKSDNITLLSIVEAWPIRTWFSLTERTLHQSEKLYDFAENDHDFFVIKDSLSLEKFIQKRKENPKQSAGMLGIEGAHALEGKFENLQKVYDAGIRTIGLTHFFDNKVGGSAHGVEQGGLTEFGRLLIREMERLNIIVDLSHNSPKLIDDVLNIAKRPVIVSHTGVKGTNDSPRNLSDQHIKRIATNGGLIGIGMFYPAVHEKTMKATADAMRYLADLVGVKYIALGSDFDGAVETHSDVTGLALLVDELFKQNFSRDEIRLIMGENVKRFFLENLPKK